MTDKNNMKDTFQKCKEWILNHNRIVFPAVIAICVVITVIVALVASKKEAANQTVDGEAVTAEANGEIVVPEDPFEVNAYPEINNLISSYYQALAAGDVDAVMAINNYVDDTEKIRIAEISKYIESYPIIDVYTKKGPVENSFVAYAYSHVKFYDYDVTVPGMQAFYICQKEDGTYYINEGERDESVLVYCQSISLQDDVVDLNNKVTVEYTDLCASDSNLSAFLVELDNQLNISVGEILAAAEAESEAATEAETATVGAEVETETETTVEEPEEDKVMTARTTDVVNIRSSDSETADKLGKAQKGETFTILENKLNGWSRIEYNGEEAYIRSDYLEMIEEEPAEPEDDGATENEDTQEDDTQSSTSTTTGDGETRYVTAIENVNIRSGQSETSDKLGVAYRGEKLELIMELANGWCKVKYDGETAYVKSEYVEID